MLPRSPHRAAAAAADAAVALLLAAAAWLLYGRALHLWWTHDDLYHLHLILGSPRAWYFWDTAVYRQPPPKMLTPLLFLSLDVDRWLFGLRPAAFHAHQLLSLSLISPALYAVLRLWLSRAWAALGAFLFLLGPPVASISLMVMVRHYVEVVPLMAASVELWVLALRRPLRGAAWAAVSAFAWFLAALAKETAVPLILFLPLIPEGSIGERLRRWVPHGIALLAYVAVRFHFLGGPAQSYGFAVEKRAWPLLALEMPAKVALEMRGLATPLGWAFLAAVLGGLAAAACLSRGAALRVLAALALALAPVLPVAAGMEPRYAAAPWLVLAMAFPFAMAGLAARGPFARRAAAALALATCGAGLAANRLDWAERSADSERRSAEARAYLAMPPGAMLRQPLGVPGELGELRWWKEDVLGLPSGAGCFMDDLYLCLHPQTGRIWGWEPAARRVVDLTPRIPLLRQRTCASLRGGAPLQVEIRAAEDGIAWELGPYEEGRYRFVLNGGAMALDMPRAGGFHLRALTPLALRVRYQAPEGWVTYSPELRMDLARAPVFRWARPGG